MAFPCFQLLYMTHAIDKMDGRGLINTARHERQPKKSKVVIPTEELPKRQSASVIKVSEQMHSNNLKEV